MRLFVYLPLMLIFFSNCKKQAEPAPSLTNNPAKADTIDHEDYIVYDAVINQNLEYKQEILVEQATIFGVFQFQEMQNTNIDTTTFKNYVENNKRSYNLGNNFNISPRTSQILSKDAYNELLSNGKKFKKLFPKSDRIIKFSRVGYNKDKTAAIVSLDSWFVNESENGISQNYGYGNTIYLEKVNGSWRVIKIGETWIT